MSVIGKDASQQITDSYMAYLLYSQNDSPVSYFTQVGFTAFGKEVQLITVFPYAQYFICHRFNIS